MNEEQESVFQHQSRVQSWLIGLPADSIVRLRQINQSASSSKHIILTLAYGLYDANIRKLNRMITGLLIARLKAERAGKEQTIERINQYMEGIHEAIDFATDTDPLHRANKSGGPCNRPAGYKQAMAPVVVKGN